MSITTREEEHDNERNENRGPLLVGATCMMITLCTATVILRVLARRRTKMKFWADDYLAFLAHVRITSWSRFILWPQNHLLMRHPLLSI